MQRFALRLSTQISPNAEPATNSDIPTSPNVAPATPNVAPAMKSDSKCCACHQEWDSSITKGCACHEKWCSNITKCSACFEKRHSDISKCCGCHQKWRSNIFKYCAWHKSDVPTSRPPTSPNVARACAKSHIMTCDTNQMKRDLHCAGDSTMIGPWSEFIFSSDFYSVLLGYPPTILREKRFNFQWKKQFQCFLFISAGFC